MRTREQIAADAKPFADSVIKQVPPRNEDYVKWQHYAQRLLLAHGAYRYSVLNVTHGRQVTDTKDGPKETYIWAVTVRIQFADHEFYDGVGSSDTPEAAESQAFKRACAHAGIGLHLYGDYWLHGQLTKDAPEPAKRKTADDYKNAIETLLIDLIGPLPTTHSGTLRDEVDAAWPAVMEKAGVLKVSTKREYEAVVRAANDMYGGVSE